MSATFLFSALKQCHTWPWNGRWVGAELILESDPGWFSMLHVSCSFLESLYWLHYTSLQSIWKIQTLLISQEHL